MHRLCPLLHSEWAVAGRDRARLEALVGLLGGGTTPGIVVADVATPDSLLAMARWGMLHLSVVTGAVQQLRCWR